MSNNNNNKNKNKNNYYYYIKKIKINLDRTFLLPHFIPYPFPPYLIPNFHIMSPTRHPHS